MNKKCFRIIFSKTLQRLIVTSELAKSADKSGEQSHEGVILSSCQATVKPLVFGLYCALGFVLFAQSTSAETLIIKADPAAPKQERPIILQTASGVPQVNIQTPNAQGLSHNKYVKFDVDTKGVILNNSRTDVATQQAGWVQGNPHLARGEAKVILNEVNSADPSILKGYVEVAGKKADVIIANPSGIHCDGCGVINSERATITTGTPQINQGNLEAFVVEKGKVSVAGRGMDNSRVDYTEIIAREKQVNAGIWSKKAINVAVGKNTVKRSVPEDGLQIIHQHQTDNTEIKPQFAIDVGELGGMYAGKVHLVGTEQGVGVRNAGHIGADFDSVKIDASGKLYNSGIINAAKSIDINTDTGIENRGRIDSKQGDVNLTTKAHIQQDGSVVARAGQVKAKGLSIAQKGETVARDTIDYQAYSVFTARDSLMSAGVNFNEASNTVNRTPQPPNAQGKAIRVKTTYAWMGGRQVASGTVDVQAEHTELTGSHIGAYDIQATSTSGDLIAERAQLRAKNNLSLNTLSLLSLQHSYLEAQRILPQFARLDTTRTYWKQLNDDDFIINRPEGFVNQGIFDVGGHIRVNAAFLDNRNGGLIAGKSLVAQTSQGGIDNRNGILSAKRQLNLNTDRLDNTSGYIYGRQVDLTVQDEIINHHTRGLDAKGIASISKLSIKTNRLDNESGQIQSLRDLNLSSGDLLNHHGIIHTQGNATLNLSGSYQAVDGRINAKEMTIAAQDFRQTDNAMVNADKLELNLRGQLDNRHSRLLSQTHLNISSLQADNRQGEIIAQGQVNIDTQAQPLLMEGGKLLGQQGVTLRTGELDNRHGQISGANIDIESKALENSQGKILAEQKLQLRLQEGYQANKGRIEAGEGEISAKVFKQSDESAVVSTDVLRINTQDALVNTDSLLFSRNHLDVAASHINSSRGKMVSEKGRLTVDARGRDLISEQGLLKGGSAVSLKSGNLNNRAGRIESGGELSLQAQTVNNDQAVVFSRQGAHIQSLAFSNKGGEVHSSEGGLALDTQGQQIDNQNGRISARQDLTVSSAQLDNRGGLLRSEADVMLNTQQQALLNTQTLNESLSVGIVAGKALNIHSGDIDNRQGLIKAGLQASVVGRQLDNSRGLITTQAADFTLNALTQQQGTLKVVDNLKLKVDQEVSSTHQSQISAKNIAADVGGKWRNGQSEVLAENNLSLRSRELDNHQGLLTAQQGQLRLNTQTEQLDNTQGKINGRQGVQIDSGKLDNTQGLIQTQGNAQINSNGQALINRETLQQSTEDALSSGIIALAKLTLQSGDLDNYQGNIYSLGNQHLHTSDLDNRQGQVIGLADQTLQSGNIQNQRGILSAKGNSQLTATSLTGEHSLVKADNLDLSVQTVRQTASEIKAQSTLNMRGDTLSSTAGSQISGAQVTLEMQGEIDNSQSRIQATQDLRTISKGLVNQQGVINTAKGTLRLDTQQHQLNNREGDIDAADTLSIQSGQLDNTKGKVESRNGTEIDTHGQALINTDTLSDNASNGIYTKGKLTIHAGDLHNARGRIFSERELTTRVDRTVDNTAGSMDSVGVQQLSAGNINNRTGQISSQDHLSVNAGELINQRGDILSRKGLSLQVSGNVENVGGTIASQAQDVSLKAADFDNRQGVIHAIAGNLTLLAGGAFNNAQGKVVSQGDVTLNTQSINNHQGVISTFKGFNVNSQGEINNRHGQIIANTDSQIKSEAFHNQQGIVSSLEGSLSLEGRTQINNQAEGPTGSAISAAKSMIITTAALNNQNTKGTTPETEKKPTQGILGDGIQLNAHALNNAHGGVYSSGELNLGKVKQLSNRGGILYSAKKQQIEADEPSQPAVIDNQGGVIEAGGVSLRNVRFSGSRYGTIKAFDASEIEMDGDLTITAQDKWYFSALRLLVSGKFINQGRFEADAGLTIKAKEIVNGLHTMLLTGVKGQLELNANNIRNQGVISGGYNVISATGTIDNSGSLISGLLRLKAQKLVNGGLINSTESYIESSQLENNGQIVRSQGNDSGQTLIQIKADNIINRGEINADFTHILSGTLRNIGSGTIVGKHTGISAQLLENRPERLASGEMKLATIGATERLDLGVKRLINKDESVIFSLGDMALGGRLNDSFEAEGKADFVDNASAKFDIQGNAWVNAAQFLNRDTHVREGAPLVTREYIKQYARFVNGAQVSEWLQEGKDGHYYRNNRSHQETWFDRHYGRDVYSQAGVVDIWRERDITRTTTETQFVDRLPAQFLVGGSLSLNGDRLHNQYSHLMIGKTLYLNHQPHQSNPQHQNLPAGGQELINEDLIKQRTVEDTGHQIDYIREEGNCDIGGYVHCLLRKEIGRTPIYDAPKTEKIPLHLVRNDIGGSTANGNYHINMPPPVRIEQTAFEHFTVKAQGQLADLSDFNLSVQHGLNIDLSDNSPLTPGGKKGRDSAYLYLQPKVADDGIPVQSGAVNSLLEATIYRDALRSPDGLDNGLYQQLYRALFGADGKNNRLTGKHLGQVRLPQVRTHLTDIRLPQDSRFKLNPEANSPYWYGQNNLPGYHDWLDSDYLKNQLSYNGEWRLKRLGDGYYEQQLVKEQVMSLTGRRYVVGFDSDEAQYRELMNNAVDYAKAFNLRPGIGLTASQMSRLTRDMVWMVERDVMINGQKQKVLVPQVYLVNRHTDVDGAGAIVSANQIKGKVAGTITNSGRLSGVVSTDLKANILTNHYGTIEGGRVDLHTTQKLQNLGGRVRANSHLRAISDGDIDLGSTLSEGSLAELKGEGEHQKGKRLFATLSEDSKRQLALVDSISELSVSDLQGQLEVNAKRNVNATGAQIYSGGSAVVHADGKVNLGTLKQRDYRDINQDNFRRIDSELDTEISAVNSVLVSGDKGVDARGGLVHSEKGDVTLHSAEGEVRLSEAREVSEIAEHARTKKKKAAGLSKKVSEKRTYAYDEETRGTTLAGKNVKVIGQKVHMTATQAHALQDVIISGTRGVTIEGAVEKSSHSHYESSHKRGITGSAKNGAVNVGLTDAKASGLADTREERVNLAGISADKGNVTVVSEAGNTLIKGTLMDAGRDMYVQGKNVKIEEINTNHSTHHESSSRRSGVSVGMVYNPFKAAKEAHDDYLSGLTANQKQKTFLSKFSNKANAVFEGASRFATPVTGAVGSHNYSERADGQHQDVTVSKLGAGRHMTLVATEGNILARGADLSAEGNYTAFAKGNITYEAAKKTSQSDGIRKSSGAGWDTAKTQNAISLYRNEETDKGETEVAVETRISVGGRSFNHAQNGNIHTYGTQIATTGDNMFKAGGNVTFDAAKSTQKQAHRSRGSGMGSEEISETDRFAGYYQNKSNDHIDQVVHKGSLIGSEQGNVIVDAGGNYLQASSQVIANNGKVSVSAADIKTITYDDVVLQESRDSNLKIGGFAKVSSPLLSLIQQAQSTRDTLQDDNASKRLKSLKTAATALEAYKMSSELAQGVLARAEVSAGFRYGSDAKRYYELTSKGNTLNGKKGVELTAREGKITLNHTDVTTKDGKGEVNKQGYVWLDAKKGIDINSGRHEWESKAKQESYGFQVGTGFQVGAGTGWYFFVEANAGQDKQSSKVYNRDNSHIETGTFMVKTGGDFNMNGASAYADTIKGNIAGKLTINSQQSEEEHKSSGSGLHFRAQGGPGSAWGGEASGHHQQANSHFKQVVEQSGLFAGNGGYDVTAQDVYLKGGAIAGTNPQNSRLITNSIQFEDIQNESHAKVSSFGGGVKYDGGSSAESGKTQSGNTPHTSNGPNASNATTNTTPQGLVMGMPSFASSSQSDAGVTRATLTPGTLILNKDSHPTVTDIKSLGINTELSLANQQVDKPNIDKLKENQEIAALTGQVGSFAVGELGQRMGLEEGSWQKAALHGAVGALSAQLSRGNVKAGAAAGAATEVINTQIANALAAHTDLSPQARNNLQQVTAMVAGATAGNLVGNNTNSTVQGANTGLASEVFNRQLHPKELQQIHDHVKEFAKQQGITEEEAERQLTEETLRGASDDFANVKENQVARAYLNQLQRMEDGQHLFGVLDRNSSEYKNSLINAQYVTPNKDLYNRVNRDSKNYATTTADYVLNAAIREGKRNYQQAGKETVSQVYGHARAEANRYRELERYHSEQESKQDQSLARKYSRQANSLTSAMAENYTSGTGVFSLKELYANKDPLAKTMLENIAESGYATGVGASLRAAGHTQVTPAQVKESASTALKPVIDSAKNYSAKIPEEANANSKLPLVGETKGYENQDVRISRRELGPDNIGHKTVTCSFRGDMEVKTEQGYKPIQSIKVGDKVYAKNELTGQMTYKRVQAHYNNPYDFTVYVEVIDEQGKHQTIVSNKIHPFFTQVTQGERVPSSEGHHYNGEIQNAQWVDAQNLKAGYKLLSANNHWQTVKGITIKAEKLSAYNLTVETDHTYFIKGANSDVDGVWVHNDCYLNLPDSAVKNKDGTFSYKDRDGQNVILVKKEINGVDRYVTLNHKEGDPTYNKTNKLVDPETSRFIADPNKVGELYPRPHYRTYFMKELEGRYQKLDDGTYKDLGGNIIQGPIDIGHAPGWEHRRLQLAAKEYGMSKPQFNDYVNSIPQWFRLENRSVNRSHKDEMPGNDNLTHIMDSMREFLNNTRGK